MTASDEARKRIADYLARRSASRSDDQDHIHGYDVSLARPNGIALKASDICALLAEIAAKDAALTAAMDALNELARHPEDEGHSMLGDFRYYYRDACNFAKKKVEEISAMKGDAHE